MSRLLFILLLLLLHDCQGASFSPSRAAQPAPYSSCEQAVFPFAMHQRRELLVRIAIASHLPSTDCRPPLLTADSKSETTGPPRLAWPGADLLCTFMSFQL